VPPDSQIVAGAAARSGDRNRGNFLFFTRANTLDLVDFFSIVGVDASRKIDQIIFAASAPGGRYTSLEHSVLVGGDFDVKRIYMSAQSTSMTTDYRGVRVLVVHPFQRERTFLNQDRWFAIIDSHLAIFGTVSSAQREIARFLAGATPDDLIVKRLSALRSADDTWCLVSSLAFGADISRVLKDLDPAFVNVDEMSDTILFGIKYGREVEFEYVVNALPEVDSVMSPPARMSFKPPNSGFLFTRDSASRSGSGSPRVVKIPRARYDKWLAGLTQH